MYKMYKHEGMLSIVGGGGDNIWLKYPGAQDLALSLLCMDKMMAIRSLKKLITLRN